MYHFLCIRAESDEYTSSALRNLLEGRRGRGQAGTRKTVEVFLFVPKPLTGPPRRARRQALGLRKHFQQI